MKAILVIDMPKSCDECMLCDTHEITENGYDYANCYALHQDIKAKFDSDGRFMIKKPNHCPLKPMPQKKEVEVNEIKDIMSVEYSIEDFYKDKYVADIRLATDKLIAIGYNDCIDEILGKQE